MADRPPVTPWMPGSARVEYFACREDVEVMLAKGYSVQMVYEQMQEQGRVTCSYSAFCDYVRGGGKRLHSRRKGKQKAPLSTPARTDGPKIINQSQGSFPDPRSMNMKDGI